MIAEGEILAALEAVRDPELDEPITGLRFVASIEVDGADVTVHLRLPTYFCAANFAWMMVSDAERALRDLPGVERARVLLDDHFASEELETGGDFQAVFPGEADGALDELRDLFARKAFLARQQAVCETLGRVPATVGEVPEGDPYLRRRQELGLDMRPGSPFLVTAAGKVVRDPERHLRMARTIRVSIESNASLCRGLLATRYGLESEVAC